MSMGVGTGVELTDEYLLAEAGKALDQLRQWRKSGGWQKPGSEKSVNTKHLNETVLVDHPHREAVMSKIRQLVAWNDYAE